jgi:hypothetical protein
MEEFRRKEALEEIGQDEESLAGLCAAKDGQDDATAPSVDPVMEEGERERKLSPRNKEEEEEVKEQDEDQGEGEIKDREKKTKLRGLAVPNELKLYVGRFFLERNEILYLAG